MLSKQLRKIILTAAAVMLNMSLLAMTAGAHLPVVLPDNFEVSAGGTVNIKTGLAEPLIEFAYSHWNLLKLGYAGGVANLSGEVRFADGSTQTLSYSPSNPANEGESTYEKAAVAISKPGTAVISTRFDFNSGTRPTVAYGKTLVNWTADSSATVRHGGNEVLEIVQVEDSGPISVGAEVTVQVFLRGSPLAGGHVSATYDGAPLPTNPREEGEESNNEYILKTTDSSGQATFRLNYPETWVIAIEHVDENAPKNKQEYDSYTEWKGIRYRAALSFKVKDEPNHNIFVTDDLIAEGQNLGRIGGIADTYGLSGWTQRLDAAGYVPAYKYPLRAIEGSTRVVSGKPTQLRDNGFSFDIPLSEVPSGKTAYAYIEGIECVVSASDLGDERFDKFVADVKKIDETHRYHGTRPGWLILEYEEERELISQYGLNFVWEYPDGITTVITGGIMGGIYYADADSKREILIATSFGVADDAKPTSSPWDDIMFNIGMGDQPLSIIHDGQNDGRIKGAMWLTLADEEPKSGSGGGCDAGFGLAALIIGLGALSFRKRIG